MTTWTVHSLFDDDPIVVSDRASPILSTTPWPSNAHLIVDCARLGYLQPEWNTLDATYGRGKFWTIWRPEKLTTNDIDPESDADHHCDFRDLPFSDGEFDAAIYDPPYITGGGDRSTIDDFNDRYGLDVVPRNGKELRKIIDAGFVEVARCVRDRGFVLVKCKNYVESGFEAGVFLLWKLAVDAGHELVDALNHVGGTGPQPPHATQRHSRSNYSTLLVFKVKR